MRLISPTHASTRSIRAQSRAACSLRPPRCTHASPSPGAAATEPAAWNAARGCARRTELFDSVREAVHVFPGDYNPTSWRRWVVDQPWYCVEWTHAAEVDAHGPFGTALDGTPGVDYGERYYQGFERGERFSSQTVGEAVLRMS